MHLYIDTFITDIPLHNSNKNYNKPLKLLEEIRSRSYTYRHQQKKDIFKYTLSSYAPIKWDSVTIIFNCEKKEDEPEVYKYASTLFPSAFITTGRSDDRFKFLDRLKKIGNEDAWIFFSPNNDHPIISKNLVDFNSYFLEANKLYLKYPDHIISISFTHFTESINSIFKNQYLYGYYGNFPKVLSQTNNNFNVEFPIACLDSLHIYKRKNLIQFFDQDTNNGRVVRLEDLHDYRSPKHKQIVVIPRLEICRHYDGYLHTANLVSKYIKARHVPPLFIPDGFFEKNIQIKTNYKKNTIGFINMTDSASGYSFEDPNFPDLISQQNDLPFFWKDRISKLEIGREVRKNPHPIAVSQLLENPWAQYESIIKLLTHFFSIKTIRKILNAFDR